MTKAVLALAGTIYWLFLHRVVYIYMGEATFLTMLTAFLWYAIRKHREDNMGPNFYGEKREIWDASHILTFMAGGITLEGVSRFIA